MVFGEDESLLFLFVAGVVLYEYLESCRIGMGDSISLEIEMIFSKIEVTQISKVVRAALGFFVQEFFAEQTALLEQRCAGVGKKLVAERTVPRYFVAYVPYGIAFSQTDIIIYLDVLGILASYRAGIDL